MVKVNMKSALEQLQVVPKYLHDECATGRVIGLLAENGFWEGGLMINGFGVISKDEQGNSV